MQIYRIHISNVLWHRLVIELLLLVHQNHVNLIYYQIRLNIKHRETIHAIYPEQFKEQDSVLQQIVHGPRHFINKIFLVQAGKRCLSNQLVS